MNRVSLSFGSAAAIDSTAPIVDLAAERRRRSGIDLGQVRPDRSAPSIFSATPPDELRIVHDVPAVSADGRGGQETRRRGSPSGFRAGLAVSVACHVVFFVAVLLNTQQQGMGGGGVELEGISVEIISSAALESLARQPPAAASAASAEAAMSPTSVDQSEIKPQTDVQTAPRAVETPPLEPAPTERAEIIASPEPAPKREDERQKPDEPTPRERVEQVAQEASAAGGSIARASETGMAAQAAAGASQGALSRYAIEIRLALGKFRPRHGGSRGRVLVSFGLDEQGGVRFVDVAHSSGSKDLDEAARAAVLRAKFPLPPSTMTDAQRTYTVPFEFK
jgi:protein TonB